MKESPLITLVKRHSETHFANIKYGYYVLIISLVYLIGLALLRAFGRRTPSRSSSAFKNKIIYRLYDIDPAIHLGILFFAVLIPFYYHYSLDYPIYGLSQKIREVELRLDPAEPIPHFKA